jgi:hypothetical protein
MNSDAVYTVQAGQYRARRTGRPYRDRKWRGDSLVGMATRCWTSEQSCFNSRCGHEMYLSSKTSWPSRGPHILLFNACRKFFPPQRVKRRENEVHHSPSSNAGVNTEWSCTSTHCEKKVKLYICERQKWRGKYFDLIKKGSPLNTYVSHTTPRQWIMIRWNVADVETRNEYRNTVGKRMWKRPTADQVHGSITQSLKLGSKLFGRKVNWTRPGSFVQCWSLVTSFNWLRGELFEALC